MLSKYICCLVTGCETLVPPMNGDVLCSEFGDVHKICEPACNDGYDVAWPSPEVYTCRKTVVFYEHFPHIFILSFQFPPCGGKSYT